MIASKASKRQVLVFELKWGKCWGKIFPYYKRLWFMLSFGSFAISSPKIQSRNTAYKKEGEKAGKRNKNNKENWQNIPTNERSASEILYSSISWSMILCFISHLFTPSAFFQYNIQTTLLFHSHIRYLKVSLTEESKYLWAYGSFLFGKLKTKVIQSLGALHLFLYQEILSTYCVTIVLAPLQSEKFLKFHYTPSSTCVAAGCQTNGSKPLPSGFAACFSPYFLAIIVLC